MFGKSISGELESELKKRLLLVAVDDEEEGDPLFVLSLFNPKLLDKPTKWLLELMRPPPLLEEDDDGGVVDIEDTLPLMSWTGFNPKLADEPNKPSS
jgi:hypothetical protein